jgi:hypothetical protein
VVSGGNLVPTLRPGNQVRELAANFKRTKAMPMPPYQVFCYTKGCKNTAQYKIAARWSDGVVSELKTYGLCCEACLPKWLQRGRDRQNACRLTPGETLDVPGIYLWQHGKRDQVLQRLTELEERVLDESNVP